MKAPLSSRERERLHSLGLHRILDTASEQAFDDLTRLAATICEVPISLVSLVDDSRQWFKSHHGLGASETPREQAFCAYAILEPELFIVEDATLDERFADNPLVQGDPNIRFYAGAPLEVADGIRLGTLCVIDRQPRQLTPLQAEALEVLRDAVVTQLELRLAKHDLRSLDLLPVCAWCRDVRIESPSGNTWKPLHQYVAEAVPVTHGICPSCVEAVS